MATDPNVPMPAAWASIDDMVDAYTVHLHANAITTSDIAMGLLAADQPNRSLFLAMIAATALQRLAQPRLP